MFDTSHARLRRGSNLSCIGRRRFIEHNRFPVMSVAGSSRFQRRPRIAKALRDACSGKSSTPPAM
jgi:hypothetical protein